MLENRVFDFVFSRKDPAFPTHSLLVFDIQGVFISPAPTTSIWMQRRRETARDQLRLLYG